jgi:hypothetical protein
MWAIGPQTTYRLSLQLPQGVALETIAIGDVALNDLAETIEAEIIRLTQEARQQGRQAGSFLNHTIIFDERYTIAFNYSFGPDLAPNS